MANGVIEQLLDFNQGNLYPKIANVNASYIGESNVNGAAGFIKDLFAAGALDASTFEISGNKLSLKSDAVIPGTIENASSANKVKYALIIKTAENIETGYNGSQAVNINKVYQADKLTNRFRIRIPDASNNTPTYKTVGENVDIDKVYSAVFTDRLVNEFRIRIADNNGPVYKTVGTDRADIEKIYSAVKADSADEIKGSLTITYTDIDDATKSLDNWKGDNAEVFNITGISEAKYARNLKNGSSIIKGNASQLSSILTVSKDGAIAALDASIGTTATVLLSIKKNEDSYSYQWIDGTTVGGAQIKDCKEDNTNPYYILGALQGDSINVYANLTRHSPYFKGLNLYQTSDETLKTFTEDLDVNLDNLASIKKGLFYWNSDENKVLDIGVTAQSLEPLFPELVTETDGIKAVSYSKLSVVALAAIDKLYKRVKELEDEVEELKSK